MENENQDELDKWLEEELGNLDDDMKIAEDKKESNFESKSQNNTQTDKQDLTNEINIDDITGNENEDIVNIIQSIDSEAEHGLTDIGSLINSDVSHMSGKERKKLKKKEKAERKRAEKANRSKKGSFFKRKASNKSKEEKADDISNANEILNETGSTAQDMSDLGLPVKSEPDLFDELDKIEEKEMTKEKRKKEKDQKKESRKKKKVKELKEKELKIKKKKEKPFVRDEIIRISPILIVFMVTIITVTVLSLYFGAEIFSYNSKMDKASSYYVDKEYDKAYDVLAGMNLKKNDEGFYNQVMNIMKVEKHFKDFQSYIEIKLYANALEALIKGIESYDNNIGASNELGTSEILNNILADIDTSLQNYYGMTVEEARMILQMDNKSEIAKVINEKTAGININSN